MTKVYWHSHPSLRGIKFQTEEKDILKKFMTWIIGGKDSTLSSSYIYKNNIAKQIINLLMKRKLHVCKRVYAILAIHNKLWRCWNILFSNCNFCTYYQYGLTEKFWQVPVKWVKRKFCLNIRIYYKTGCNQLDSGISNEGREFWFFMKRF